MSNYRTVANIEKWLQTIPLPPATQPVAPVASSTRKARSNTNLYPRAKEVIENADLKRIGELIDILNGMKDMNRGNIPNKRVDKVLDYLHYLQEAIPKRQRIYSRLEQPMNISRKHEIKDTLKMKDRNIVDTKGTIARIIKGDTNIINRVSGIHSTRGKSIKVPRTKPRRERSASRSKTAASRGGGRRSRKNIPVRGFAVVHSAEKPWVKEANYRRWLAKLKRHTIKVRREGENEAPENMCVDSSLCKGDLGIPRRLMPQFTSPRDIRSFTTFAEKRYGIKSHRATRRAARLKPSQEEINRERVEDVQEDIVEKKLDPNVPLIVSRDGYVIDGHHRWAAYKSHHPTKKLPVLLVEAPARDVLSVAATWGAKHHQF
jgi:hypothetical protein